MPAFPNVAFFEMAPDWACEVASPSTARIDRVHKLAIYAREGVGHVWLVDALARTLEVYRLEEKRYFLLNTYEGEAVVRAEPFDAIEPAPRAGGRALRPGGGAVFGLRASMPEEDRAHRRGMIGGTLAHLCALKGLGDVVLFTIEGMPQERRSTSEGGPIEGFDAACRHERLRGHPGRGRLHRHGRRAAEADEPRRPPRHQRQDRNTGQHQAARAEGVRHRPTNPLDAMVTLMKQRTGFPKQQVVGMAGVLVAPPFVPRRRAEGVGDERRRWCRRARRRHGPDPSHTTIGGIPVAALVKPERLAAIESRTRQAGGEIVALLKTGSAFYSPASAAIQMADAYLNDRRTILPCAAYLEGEYGIRGLYVGVPVQIGAGGVERVLEIDLTPDERKALDTSASHVRELVEAMGRVLAKPA
jgi:malate dehydrogenase